MRTKLAATAVALTLGIGGGALAPTAGATPAHTPQSASPASSTLAPGFYAGGTWQLVQSNGFTVTVHLRQSRGGNLIGSASYSGGVGRVLSGAVKDNTIAFTIRWPNGILGRYTGSLTANRQLTGVTYVVGNPGLRADWHTDRTF
ncbi:hypothetical protein [Embleya sp. AB8]|uniref:hypothetical protein n=1 Tax=Embleya sp. AB8 TaxID=3156304 RepID=UPI003C746A5C